LANLQIAARNSIQAILISLIRSLKNILNTKIVLFSRFMANADGSSYLVKKTKISGSTYILHSNDYGVSRRIYIGLDDEHLKAVKAINLINASSRFAKGGRITHLLDIGANIGHISIPLLEQGILLHAIAWEPDPENFKLLKCNIILNGLEEKVTLYNLALGRDSGKTLKFELSEDNFGDHRIRVSDDSGKYNEKSRKIIEVKSETLDSYIDTFRQENLSGNQLILWIDVQGYEGEVLAGARTLIDQMKPAIGMEFWPYGLDRANGIDPLIDAIRRYDTYLDLRQPKPRPQSISNLFDIYSKNKHNDEYILDILLL
jgi:FkbM family methyltransferase